MVVKADVKYAVTFRPKNEDRTSQIEVYPVYRYIESHTVGSIPLNFFENKFPSVICMWKTQMCVGWSCPWTEISTSPDHSGVLGNLSIHICGGSGLFRNF